MKNNISTMILTVFCLGKVKFAPGTLVSLICTPFWFFISSNISIRFFICMMILFVGFYYCRKYSRNPVLGKDPSMIVIDEFAGMSIVLFMIEPGISMYALGFVLFRFFDILKPSFIYHSQFFENGIGIMLDDVLAGIIVLLILLGISI